jgi:hypothetical protein
MTAYISPSPRLQFFTNTGVPMAGGLLYTYAAGTTTPLATYTDSSGTIANTNPVILDSRGEASIWLSTVSYKFKLATPVNIDIWTQDNVTNEVSSANMLYTPAGTGAVTTTVQAKLRESVSVKDFGAVGNGVSDDTAAIQLAVNSGAKAVYFPAGTYNVSSTITVNIFMTLHGDGELGSTVRTTSATANVFSITSIYACGFSDLRFSSTVVRTAGAYVIGPTSLINIRSTFNKCQFILGFEDLNLINMVQMSINECLFSGNSSISVNIECPLSPDTGDNNITGCTWNGTGVAIRQRSSGGLKISGNKFLNGTYHFLGVYNTVAPSTSILMFENNSSEMAGVSAIALTSTAGTPFSRVMIIGNEFTLAAGAICFQALDPGYVWLSELVIGSNLIAMGASSTGLSILRVNRASILTNSFYMNGAGTTGLEFSVNATSVTVAPQDFFGIVTTPYIGNMTGVTFSPGRIEKASVAAVVTNVAYGPLYASAVQSVVFGQVYGKTPSITFSPFSADGLVSVIVSATTAAGFNFTAIGVTNGGSTTVGWQAIG